jgi:hypothetical protein
MAEPTSLLPPLGEINRCLTRNQRERRRLEVLRRLALEEADDRRKFSDRYSEAVNRPQEVAP